jgi:hypothetical protein
MEAVTMRPTDGLRMKRLVRFNLYFDLPLFALDARTLDEADHAHDNRPKAEQPTGHDYRRVFR